MFCEVCEEAAEIGMARRIIQFVKRVWWSLPVDGAGLSHGGPIEARRLRAFVVHSFWRRFPWWARLVLVPATRLAWLLACPVHAATALRRFGGGWTASSWRRLTIDGWRWGVHPVAALTAEYNAAVFDPIRIETVHPKIWAFVSRWIGAEECAALARDKAAMAAALSALGAPTPTILMEIPAGEAVDAATLPWPAEGALFIKPRHGSRGVGAFSVARSRDGGFIINNMQIADKSALDRKLTQGAARDSLLVQEHLSPAPEIRDLSPNDPVQLRLFVGRRPGGEPFLLSCFAKILRQGRYGAVAPSGALAVAVDPATGRMERGVLMTDSGVWHSAVPWNGAPVEGRATPGYADAVAAVLTGAKALADHPVIGWDVLLTDRGPVILEANTSLSWNYLHLRQAQNGERATFIWLFMEWLDYAERRAAG